MEVYNLVKGKCDEHFRGIIVWREIVMKRFPVLVAVLSAFLFISVEGFAHSAGVGMVQAGNRIEGTVFDPQRRGVSNVYVELLSDTDSILQRVMTTGSGRFTFSGMSTGRYVVKVTPYSAGYLEDRQEVNVGYKARGSGDTEYVDFYLKPDKRAARPEDSNTPREVLFAQDVPQAARKLYQDGTEDLSKKPEKGILKLEEAVKVFPEYFDALYALGKAYNSMKAYDKAYPYLMRAIDVNGRSFGAYYSLGYAFLQLKQYPAASEAARACSVLAPESPDAFLLYGTTLRLLGKISDAEKILVKANTAAKSTNAEIHWQLALVYNRQNRNQEAVSELETYLKLNPNNPERSKIEEMINRLRAGK